MAITGARGFIGKELVRHHLRIGDDVRVLSRAPGQGSNGQRITEYQCDLARPDAKLLERFAAGASVLYHCAAEIRDTDLMQAVQVGGTAALVSAAAGTVRRWVQLSSVGVYGRFLDGEITEDAPERPVGTYETTKARSDALVLEAAASGAFSAKLLRPSIVFGRSMRNRSLHSWARAVERRVFFFVGRPGASANYIHVSNVVNALALCASARENTTAIYNVSDWRTVENFVGTIAETLEVVSPRLRISEEAARKVASLNRWIPGWPLTQARVDALVTRAKYPTTVIEAQLGYTHATTMEQGLRETLRRSDGDPA